MVQKNEHMFEKMNITSLAFQTMLFLARNPDKEYYIREIATLLNKSVGGIHYSLQSLTQHHLVCQRKSGRNLYYRINQDNASIQPFKIFSTILELTPAIDEIKGLSSKIVLFGSCSTGNDTQNSDIDLFILSSQAENIKRILLNIKTPREIQATVISAHEFLSLKENDRGFFEEIKKGILLWELKNE